MKTNPLLTGVALGMCLPGSGQARAASHTVDGGIVYRWPSPTQPTVVLWQTLRSSCEKEWAASFPQYAVSLWMGHGITISGKPYANAVPDELFDKAAQKAAQQEAAGARIVSQEKRRTPRQSQETAYSGSIPKKVNGGGGNRTRVPWHFNRGFYVRSRLI
jgi:hypothetical protein